jgi:DNA-binding FadR family transcriptional regulator
VTKPPNPVSRRVAEYRKRQKQAGLVHLSLMVPAADVPFFRELANGVRQKNSVAASAASATTPAEPAIARPLSGAKLKLAQRWAAHSGLKLRLTRPGLKLGDLLARNIAHEVALADWPVGRNLGSEAELMSRYGVGRSVLREAIRLLEHQSVASMRRGPSGGLIVSEPVLEGAAYATGIYLQSRHFQSTDLLATRQALELHIIDRCLLRMDPQAREKLNKVIAFEKTLDASASASNLQRFHATLALITGDPALYFFLDTLLRMSRFRTKFHQHRNQRALVVSAVIKAHAAITRYLLQGDRERARRAMQCHLDALGNWIE